LEKALRRQAGVEAVDIDTRASTCVVGYAKPRKLDFAKLESAATDANYVLTGVSLQAKGEVVSGHCDSCKSDVFFLQLPGTKEKLELSGPATLGTASLNGSVLDWNSDHPRLEVK
jgi:hypothetical protein